MMGEVGFANLEVDWPKHVMVNFTWSLALNTQLKPIERHAVLYFLEQGLMPVVANETADYGYEGENRHFVQCFLKGEQPELSFYDGLAVTELLMAAYKSAEEERKIYLSSHYKAQSSIAEAYRNICTNLKLGPTKKSILVSSASPGEGKSAASAIWALLSRNLAKKCF
jgi:hypothetical protein